MANSGAILATTNRGFSAAPGITKLTPSSAKRDATVTITKASFGAAQGTSSVKFGSKKCTKCVSWSATQIKCKAPAATKCGALKVTTPGGAAASVASFTVVPAPAKPKITKLKPASAKRGAGRRRGQVRRHEMHHLPLLEGHADQVQGAGQGRVRHAQAHGDHRGRREQGHELHGEALTA